jgi:hypothetical protein
MFSRDSFGAQLENHCDILVKQKSWSFLEIAISYSPMVVGAGLYLGSRYM